MLYVTVGQENSASIDLYYEDRSEDDRWSWSTATP